MIGRSYLLEIIILNLAIGIPLMTSCINKRGKRYGELANDWRYSIPIFGQGRGSLVDLERR